MTPLPGPSEYWLLWRAGIDRICSTVEGSSDQVYHVEDISRATIVYITTSLQATLILWVRVATESYSDHADHIKHIEHTVTVQIPLIGAVTGREFRYECVCYTIVAQVIRIP